MFTKKNIDEALNKLPDNANVDWLTHDEGFDNIVFTIALIGEERPRLIVVDKEPSA